MTPLPESLESLQLVTGHGGWTDADSLKHLTCFSHFPNLKTLELGLRNEEGLSPHDILDLTATVEDSAIEKAAFDFKHFLHREFQDAAAMQFFERDIEHRRLCMEDAGREFFFNLVLPVQFKRSSFEADWQVTDWLRDLNPF